jgi:YD repeat-containing protein
MNGGDVIVVRFPHPSGLRGKKRPAVVVQSDAYAAKVNTLIVAEVTKNLTMASDPACLFIDTSTSEGKATGLVRDSVVSCLVFVTVYSDAVGQVITVTDPETEAQRLSEDGAGHPVKSLDRPMSWTELAPGDRPSSTAFRAWPKCRVG